MSPKGHLFERRLCQALGTTLKEPQRVPSRGYAARTAKVGAALKGSMVFEQAFKNFDDILHSDGGCTSELNYTEQSSWLLLLKYLDALELDKATEAALQKKNYTHIIDEKFRRSTRAAPRGANGKVDRNTAATGADLIDLVNQKLIPYLRSFS